MTGLDSNVLVRYFTRDDEAQARAARKFIERAIGIGERLHVSLVALAELAWVLRSRYKVKRNEVSTLVESLLSEPGIHVQDSNAVWMALDACAKAGIDFSDALVAAVDRLHGCSHSVTLDAKAARIPGMTLLE